MLEFFRDAVRHTFLRYALITGVLSSVACGVVGSYLTVRRITYIAGAIAHSILAGMGAALYLQRNLGWSFLSPMHGAVFAALLSAIIIGMVSLYGKEREDTALSAVWAIGMAAGIVFITRTPGYTEDLMSYLFGNILMVRKTDLLLIVGLDLLVVVLRSVGRRLISRRRSKAAPASGAGRWRRLCRGGCLGCSAAVPECSSAAVPECSGA